MCSAANTLRYFFGISHFKKWPHSVAIPSSVLLSFITVAISFKQMKRKECTQRKEVKTKINISKNVEKWNHTKNREQSSYRLDKDGRLRRQLTLAMKRAGEIWFFTLRWKEAEGVPGQTGATSREHMVLSPALPPTPILPNITQTKDNGH